MPRFNRGVWLLFQLMVVGDEDGRNKKGFGSCGSSWWHLCPGWVQWDGVCGFSLEVWLVDVAMARFKAYEHCTRHLLSHFLPQLLVHLRNWGVQWAAVGPCGEIRLDPLTVGVLSSVEAKAIHAFQLFSSNVIIIQILSTCLTCFIEIGRNE